MIIRSDFGIVFKLRFLQVLQKVFEMLFRELIDVVQVTWVLSNEDALLVVLKSVISPWVQGGVIFTRLKTDAHSK